MKRKILKAITKFVGTKVPLSKAIRYNRIEDVKIAVEMKTDLNFHFLYDKQSFIYPLMTSVYYGRKDICELFLDARADPNFKFKSNSNDHHQLQRTLDLFNTDLFLPFFDPKCRISNEFVPQLRRPFDLTGWKDITPTVLAFVLGEVQILELCLSRGGRLCTHFDSHYYSLVWYFLEHPTTCHSAICDLLIKYREFSVTDFEQNAFYNFCDKLEVMKRHINLSDDLSRDLEKIMTLLESYGFKRRIITTPISPNQPTVEGNFSPNGTTSTDGDGDGKFIRYCVHQRRRRRTRIIDQDYHQQEQSSYHHHRQRTTTGTTTRTTSTTSSSSSRITKSPSKEYGMKKSEEVMNFRQFLASSCHGDGDHSSRRLSLESNLKLVKNSIGYRQKMKMKNNNMRYSASKSSSKKRKKRKSF